jgi:hypothetical protein
MNARNPEQAVIAPVRHSVVVNAPVERAFTVFTDGFGTWWPKSHTISAAPVEQAIIEPRAGGARRAPWRPGSLTPELGGRFAITRLVAIVRPRLRSHQEALPCRSLMPERLIALAAAESGGHPAGIPFSRGVPASARRCLPPTIEVPGRKSTLDCQAADR